MSPFDEPRLSPWEEEGRRHGSAVDDCHFVVLLGDDPAAAAELALGLARVQARRRRAAVADAVGELPCIEDLAPMDAPHGIVDVCIHGVSLAQVAHRVDAAGSLEVLPSGPIPFDRAAVLRSPRWERLAAEFRETGAILLLVAPVDEPGVASILPLADGVVLTGRAQPWPGARVLLYVKSPGSGSYGALSGRPTPAYTPAPAPDPAPAFTRSPTPAHRATPAPRHTTARPPLQEESNHWPLWVTVATGVLLLGGALWQWYSANRAPQPGRTAVAADSTGAASFSPDSFARRAAAVAADSDRRAAAWTVDLGGYASATDANERLEDDALRALPATTWSPVTDLAGNLSWRLYAGAWADRAPADSLLADLRARAVIPADAGSVVRLPFAVVVQSGITRDEASFFATGLRQKGLPVYPLIE
jgi:hypothetical protein